MPYALELLFDSATAMAVSALSGLLQEGRTNQDRLQDPASPHLSLLVADSLDLSAIATVAASIPMPISDGVQLGPIAAFTSPAYVLYLTVEEIPELRAFQRRLFQRLSGTAKGIWDYYTPDAWIPHVTISQGTPIGPERLRTLERLSPIPKAQFTEFLVVEFARTQRQEHRRIPIHRLLPEEIAHEEVLWRRFDQDLTSGAYFDAHEAIEELWRRDRDPRQQSAIWIAAAFVHWSKGTLSGAQKLLIKLTRDAAHRPDPLMPVVERWMAALAENLPNPGITPTERKILVRWARYHT